MKLLLNFILGSLVFMITYIGLTLFMLTLILIIDRIVRGGIL